MLGVFVYFCSAILLAYTYRVDGEFYNSCVENCPSIKQIHLRDFNLANYTFYRTIEKITRNNDDKCIKCDKNKEDGLLCYLTKKNGKKEMLQFVFLPDNKYPGAVFDVRAPDGQEYKWVAFAIKSSSNCGNLIAFLFCKFYPGNGNSKNPLVVITQDFGGKKVPKVCYNEIYQKIEQVLFLNKGSLQFYDVPNENC